MPDKEKILEKTGRGIDFYKHIIPSFSRQDLPSYKIEAYNKIIRKIYEIPYTDANSSHILHYSNKALNIFVDWDKKNTDLLNDLSISANLRSIYTKFNTYIHRIALLMQVLYWACDGASLSEVTERAIISAIKIIEFFSPT